MKKFVILLLCLALIGCFQGKIDAFDSEMENLEYEFAPDKSIAVFKAELERDGANWVLRGETSSQKAKITIVASTKIILGRNAFQDSLVVLPHPDLIADTTGVVNVGIANLRRKPSVAAELIDQVLLGDKLRILKTHNRFWDLVQTKYGYIGYLQKHKFNVHGSDSKWFMNPKGVITVLNTDIHTQKTDNSEIVSNAVLNSQLSLVESGKVWTKVELPDERTGFIKNTDYRVMTDTPQQIAVEKLIVTAKSMMGIPYLWGGRSSKMNDCSGFTQMVFLANGIMLPRDARQQALIGKTVEYDSTFQQVKPGDLLFFGATDNITHVGISLGGYELIDQDGSVGIKSFNENAENYAEWSKDNLQLIKRMF